MSVGCFVWCSNELQRATLVRECAERSNEMHKDVRNGERNTAREVGGEKGRGLEFRMSGFFDTRQRCQETLSADLLPLIKPDISVGSGAQLERRITTPAALAEWRSPYPENEWRVCN